MRLAVGLRRLHTTFGTLLHEAAKFGVVGLFCFGVDTGLFNLLRYGPAHIGPLSSKAASTTVAAVLSYVFNRLWTWRHRPNTSVVRGALFFVFSAVGLLIAEACLGLSHYVMGLHSVAADNISANGFGLVLGTIFRFWAFRRWVFLEPDEEYRVREAEVAAVQ